jgi:ribosomal protein L11 methyltransferase
VIAVDNDPVALRAAQENVSLNGVDQKVGVRLGTLLDGWSAQADIIAANLVAGLIVELAPRAYQLLTAGGHFIGAGIVQERWPEVETQLLQAGFRIKQTDSQGAWVSVVAVRD